MPVPKVGFHDFLNSRPLLRAFRHGLVEQPFDLIIDTPGALAEMFHAGDLDLALIPSVEYARSDDALVVDRLCIASLGRVETVFLFSERAMEDIESVCVDPRSRTSVAMLQILFDEKLHRQPTLITGETDPDLMLRSADAGLLIGVHPLGIDDKKRVVSDLGQMWYESTGRPFVHALLCARPGAPRLDAAIAAIAEAKEEGLKHRELIAHEEAREGLSAETIFDYLSTRILYDLREEEVAGLSHFLSKAKALDLVSNDEIRFY